MLDARTGADMPPKPDVAPLLVNETPGSSSTTNACSAIRPVAEQSLLLASVHARRARARFGPAWMAAERFAHRSAGLAAFGNGHLQTASVELAPAVIYERRGDQHDTPSDL